MNNLSPCAKCGAKAIRRMWLPEGVESGEVGCVMDCGVPDAQSDDEWDVRWELAQSARAAGRREAFAECVEVCELVAASNKTSNGFSIATSAVHDAIKVRIDEVVNDCQLQN